MLLRCRLLLCVYYLTFRCPACRKSRRRLQLLVSSWVCFVAGGYLGALVFAPTVPNFTKRLACSPQAARRSSLSEQPEPCLRPCEYPSQRACWPPSVHCNIDYGPNVPCCRCILLLILVWHAVGKAIGDRLAPPSPRAAVDHDQTPLLGHAHQPHPVLR